ncbi:MULTISPECIES: hypothetical protein [Nocardia]|uniref:Uncharacterized protein n=1 Tax=Nocardia africana TaxID=134964 RepID=A0A378X7L1_9NOCA|nr:hypothetical protein [Nocardia africana]MCC3317949.1 hypothetical protein [Nocardia africana]SUA48724.1 Uncharacterised protein [Nocardia africana]
MDILLVAAVTLADPSTGSANLERPAPLILRAPDTFKAIPQIWYLPDNRPDTVASATAYG